MKRPRPVRGIKDYVKRRKLPPIVDVVRETTAGGIVYRYAPKTNKLQFLLVQDARDRWTIPKGHVEKGETTKQTAKREITEETGLEHINIKQWLGKVDFRFRRQQSLVVMITHVYLVEAFKNTDALVPEEWMNGIAWFDAYDAIDKIAYEGTAKLMLVAINKIKDAQS